MTSFMISWFAFLTKYMSISKNQIKVRWAEKVACKEENTNAYNILITKHEAKTSL